MTLKTLISAASLFLTYRWEFQKNIYFYYFIDYTNTFDCVDHNKLWEILKVMEILDLLTCLLKNLYASQEVTVTGHGTTDWSKLGKEYDKSIYYHPAYLTYMQNTSSKIPGCMNHKLESRFLGEYQQPWICRLYHSNGRK